MEQKLTCGFDANDTHVDEGHECESSFYEAAHFHVQLVTVQQLSELCV